MIFIEMQGRSKTSHELTFEIIDLLDFDEVRQIKKLTTHKKYQIGLFKEGRVIVFLNFLEEHARDGFYDKLQNEFDPQYVKFTASLEREAYV